MIDKFKDYFQDKKVFITGHTGFKGSWLTKWLLDLDANVTGFSNEIPTKPSMFEILNLKYHIMDIRGDIRNFNELNKAIVDNNPDIVIHLAAQPLVRKSYFKPVETYETNVIGTVNLLESIKKLSKINNKYNNSSDNKFLLNVTTDKCYENNEENRPFKETDPLGGYDPYSSSKACSEIVTAAYRRSFFNTIDKNSKETNFYISTARAGNVIGGGDWSEDRLVVDCINALKNNETIILRSPDALRPWQHVLEGISGYLTLLCHMMDKDNVDYTGSWNFGPYDNSIGTVESVVKLIIENWGSGKFDIESNTELHEAKFLKLNIDKATSYLDWKPILTLEESIKITIQWYKEYYSNNENLWDFTTKQINDYIKKQVSD